MAKTQEFECQFCLKTFVRESSLMAHCCVKKLRWLDKDSKDVNLGFTAWKRFYQLTKASGKSKNYKDFVESKYYNDFVNFGRWAMAEAIFQPNSYIDYLIKGSFKLKDWTKRSIYENYLRIILVKEDPASALERSIIWIENWCDNEKITADKFFDNISTNRLVDILCSGRISPWLIFTSSNSENIMSTFDISQKKLLANILDPKIWNLKLRRNRKDLDEYKKLVRSMGL